MLCNALFARLLHFIDILSVDQMVILLSCVSASEVFERLVRIDDFHFVHAEKQISAGNGSLRLLLLLLFFWLLSLIRDRVGNTAWNSERTSVRRQQQQQQQQHQERIVLIEHIDLLKNEASLFYSPFAYLSVFLDSTYKHTRERPPLSL